MKNPLLPAALALLLAACASVPPPVDALAAADLAIKRADASRGGDPSPDELKAARIKLEQAQQAMAKREHLLAARYAAEARLDADFATARNEAAKAQFNVEAMEKGNEALRAQGLRNAVNVAPIAIPAAIPAEAPLADALPDPYSPVEGQ